MNQNRRPALNGFNLMSPISPTAHSPSAQIFGSANSRSEPSAFPVTAVRLEQMKYLMRNNPAVFEIIRKNSKKKNPYVWDREPV